MKKLSVSLFALALAAPAFASPLSNTAKAVIPAAVQQIITVDYRTLNNDPTALALKERVLPAPLKTFEQALKGIGVTPEKDMEQLVFASYRGKEGLRFVGVATGQFPQQKMMLRLKKQKVKGEKYSTEIIYPMGSGLSMALLDPTTLVFGENASVKTAIDARDGNGGSLNSNDQVTNLMSSVESEAVWSVLDQQGTQTMLKSALGDASSLAEYDVVKNRLKGSRYGMKFTRGVDFNLDVLTSDSITAASLSSLVKAGMLYRKATASELEKSALEGVQVKSESSSLKMDFKIADDKFQALLNSDLFASVSK
jgi:hypothetical protein